MSDAVRLLCPHVSHLPAPCHHQVNKSHIAVDEKFTRAEAHAMLQALEGDNRIMYRNGIAHQI